MPLPTYRVMSSITVIVVRGGRRKLHSLRIGTLLIPTSEPDSAGIIEATFDHEIVQVYTRDLEECCDRIELEAAKGARAS
jgi:hypothetical protein